MGKTQQEIEEYFGQIKIDGLQVSQQVINVISKIDDFDLDKFKVFVLKKQSMVAGMTLYEYLAKGGEL